MKKFFDSSCRFTRLIVAWLLCFSTSANAANREKPTVSTKQVIGPIAAVEEVESDFVFPARVDTGATTSSLHVEDWVILDEDERMEKNVGKTIRFRLKNDRGQSEWLERKIMEISVIKTSEQEEQRYKVSMTLNCQDVKKRVLVSLNDRSHMKYPVLLGRNFLHDDFVVDVALGNEKPSPITEKAVPEKQALSASREAKQTSKRNNNGD